MNEYSYRELELLSKKIEANTAIVEDYKQYEKLLLSGGLTHDFIFSYLTKAGFSSWGDLVNARKKMNSHNETEASLVGGLLGLGLGIIFNSAISNK
jgi:hypothetical protein